MPVVPITSAARFAATSQKSIPAATFHAASREESSFPEDKLEGLSVPDPTWANVSPESFRLRGMAWRLAVACKGDIELIGLSVLSLLTGPGLLLNHQGHLSVILFTCRHGFVACKCELVRYADGLAGIRFTHTGNGHIFY